MAHGAAPSDRAAGRSRFRAAAPGPTMPRRPGPACSRRPESHSSGRVTALRRKMPRRTSTGLTRGTARTVEHLSSFHYLLLARGPRRQSAFERQLHRFVDWNAHDATVLVYPAVSFEHFVFRRA